MDDLSWIVCLVTDVSVFAQEAKDPLVKAVLDGRQLALKVKQVTVNQSSFLNICYLSTQFELYN